MKPLQCERYRFSLGFTLKIFFLYKDCFHALTASVDPQYTHIESEEHTKIVPRMMCRNFRLETYGGVKCNFVTFLWETEILFTPFYYFQKEQHSSNDSLSNRQDISHSMCPIKTFSPNLTPISPAEAIQFPFISTNLKLGLERMKKGSLKYSLAKYIHFTNDLLFHNLDRP